MKMNDNFLELAAKHLKESGALDKYAPKNGKIEDETAYALSEILISAKKLTGSISEKLSSESDVDNYREALEEFREEIRHIVYHILDSEYLSVVVDTTST